MARPGRKRKEGVREPNGRIQRGVYGPAILAATLERRADYVGMENARDPMAGTVLGRACLSGKITRRQYNAGCHFGRARVLWDSIQGIPCRYPAAIGARLQGVNPDPDPEKIQEIKEQFQGMQVALKRSVKAWMLAESILEAVCLEDVLPLRMDGKKWLGQEWYEGWQMTRDAMDALGDFFGLEKEG